jgi:hypothetical protein
LKFGFGDGPIAMHGQPNARAYRRLDRRAADFAIALGCVSVAK